MRVGSHLTVSQILGSALEGTTEVSQLRMVPLQNTHTANSVIESDRMLMVSGSLSDSSFGNVSTVLFDGETFFPYILSTSASGAPGSIAGLFSSVSSFSFTQHREFENHTNQQKIN